MSFYVYEIIIVSLDCHVKPMSIIAKKVQSVLPALGLSEHKSR